MNASAAASCFPDQGNCGSSFLDMHEKTLQPNNILQKGSSKKRGNSCATAQLPDQPVSREHCRPPFWDRQCILVNTELHHREVNFYSLVYNSLPTSSLQLLLLDSYSTSIKMDDRTNGPGKDLRSGKICDEQSQETPEKCGVAETAHGSKTPRAAWVLPHRLHRRTALRSRTPEVRQVPAEAQERKQCRTASS